MTYFDRESGSYLISQILIYQVPYNTETGSTRFLPKTKKIILQILFTRLCLYLVVQVTPLILAVARKVLYTRYQIQRTIHQVLSVPGSVGDPHDPPDIGSSQPALLIVVTPGQLPAILLRGESALAARQLGVQPSLSLVNSNQQKRSRKITRILSSLLPSSQTSCQSFRKKVGP